MFSTAVVQKVHALVSEGWLAACKTNGSGFGACRRGHRFLPNPNAPAHIHPLLPHGVKAIKHSPRAYARRCAGLFSPFALFKRTRDMPIGNTVLCCSRPTLDREHAGDVINFASLFVPSAIGRAFWEDEPAPEPIKKTANHRTATARISYVCLQQVPRLIIPTCAKALYLAWLNNVGGGGGVGMLLLLAFVGQLQHLFQLHGASTKPERTNFSSPLLQFVQWTRVRCSLARQPHHSPLLFDES